VPLPKVVAITSGSFGAIGNGHSRSRPDTPSKVTGV
jgi:hypothetical protein